MIPRQLQLGSSLVFASSFSPSDTGGVQPILVSATSFCVTDRNESKSHGGHLKRGSRLCQERLSNLM